VNQPTARAVVVLVVVAFLAFLGGQVLGEYPFSGWLPILGGFGLGAVVAGVVTRIWRGAPPVWLTLVAGLLAGWGEVLAVRHDQAPGMEWPWQSDWPWEAWAALAACAAAAWWPLVQGRREGAG
jgi:hypothetical protein